MKRAIFKATISKGNISVPDLGIHSGAIFNKEVELSSGGLTHKGILQKNGISTNSGFSSFAEIGEGEAELIIGGTDKIGSITVSSRAIDNRGYLGQQPGDMDK
jgi:hypothetical protein